MQARPRHHPGSRSRHSAPVHRIDPRPRHGPPWHPPPLLARLTQDGSWPTGRPACATTVAPNPPEHLQPATPGSGLASRIRLGVRPASRFRIGVADRDEPQPDPGSPHRSAAATEWWREPRPCRFARERGRPGCDPPPTRRPMRTRMPAGCGPHRRRWRGVTHRWRSRRGWRRGGGGTGGALRGRPGGWGRNVTAVW